jgi:excinuclease ABC subunit B
MDADKEGFLRAERSLVQTIGRAARHPEGRVIMYADRITDSMARAIAETTRRREKQLAHNQAHGIVPKAIIKSLKNSILESLGAPVPVPAEAPPGSDLNVLIKDLEAQMRQAASVLEFETASELRDRIGALREQQLTKNRLVGEVFEPTAKVASRKRSR